MLSHNTLLEGGNRAWELRPTKQRSGRREGVYFVRKGKDIKSQGILGAKIASEGVEGMVGNHLEVGRVSSRG